MSSHSQSLDDSKSKHITIEAYFVFSSPAGRGRAYINPTNILYKSAIIEGKIMSYQQIYMLSCVTQGHALSAFNLGVLTST